MEKYQKKTRRLRLGDLQSSAFCLVGARGGIRRELSMGNRRLAVVLQGHPDQRQHLLSAEPTHPESWAICMDVKIWSCENL